MQQCFFNFEEVKETILDFSQGAVKVFLIHFVLIYHQYKNDTMQHCKVSSCRSLHFISILLTNKLFVFLYSVFLSVPFLNLI